MSHLKAIAIVGALGLSAAALTAPSPAEAGSRSFSLSVPGFGLYINKGHHGHWKKRRHWKHRRHYRPNYGRYKPRYRHRGRCARKSRVCARSWGYGNRNWRGCMRYYRCR